MAATKAAGQRVGSSPQVGKRLDVLGQHGRYDESMTTKLTISVPDEIATFLRDTGNASGAVADAVRPLLPQARRERQRLAARAMAEHLRSRTPERVAEDEALIEASNDVALSDSRW